MMLDKRLILAAGATALLAYALPVRAEATNAAPDFKEVYDLIRSNLAGVSDDDLNRAAVEGLINQLHSGVSLVTGKTETNAAPRKSAQVQAAAYDGGIVTLRVGQVTDGLAGRITAAQKDLAATNKNEPHGLILDLRFAGGMDYAAAAEAADLFIPTEMPLMDWGEGPVRSKVNDSAVTLPLVVLVNKQTAGAAEALAAVLRQDAKAVVLGSTTAGEATAGRNFPLKNGQILRIATAAVKLGDGEVLTAAGVKPDIQIAVKSEDEKAYYADPFKDLYPPVNGANFSGADGGRSGRTRLTEADLIRERKERPGMDLEYLPMPDNGAKGANADKPVVHDPVLGRALDLIKGITAFRPARTP